ncbi:MAG: O-antigen ligase family protein, partial [Parcubacteria group bacterium]|nr:O-antigen ligase family protein [Parcubacteria group bacterium]
MQKLTLNTILRYALIIGIFIIPFIPFIVAKSMFFPFIVGKNFTFRIIVELMLGGWLFLAWRDSRYRPRFSWILAAYALFIGITIIADLFGENLFRSFWSNFERMDGLVNYLHFFAYFLIIGAVLNTEKLWTRFFQTTLGASVLMAFYAFAQLAGKIVINQGGARIDATLGNASYLGLYALFHVFLAAFLFVKERNVWWRVAYGVVGALNLIVLYNTATRGAILGLIGGSLLAALLMAIFERGWSVRRKISLGVVFSIIILSGLLVTFRDTVFVTNNPVLARIASVIRIESVLQEMGDSRFRIWEMGWKGFKEHPILGWGQENFNLVFSKYYDPRMYGQEPWFDRAHNVVLDRLIDGGILGFLSYLSIVFAALYVLLRGALKEKSFFVVAEGGLFAGLLVAYFFQYLFIFDQFVSYFLFFTVLAFLHFHVTEECGADEKREQRVFEQKDYLAAALIFIATLVVLYVVSINGIRANRTLLEAIRPQAEGIAKNLDYFKKALAYNHTVGIMETREQLAVIVAQITGANISQEEKKELFTLARDEMRRQIASVPNDARYRMFIANTFMSYGFFDEAVQQLEEGIRVSPKKQLLYYSLSQAYTLKGDVEKGLDALRVAFELEPSNIAARKKYAAYAIRIGQDKIAEGLLVHEFDMTLLSDY